MPSEPTLLEWWLASSALAFLLKGVVFASLAWTIYHEHRRVNSQPSRVGRELMRMFLSITGTSVLIASIFTLSLWALIHGELPPPPDWVRWVVRGLLLLSPVLVVLFGLLTFRSVRDEARARARGGTDEYRTMIAMERIADQGDALASAGVADRSATATERIADVGEGIARNPANGGGR